MGDKYHDLPGVGRCDRCNRFCCHRWYFKKRWFFSIRRRELCQECLGIERTEDYIRIRGVRLFTKKGIERRIKVRRILQRFRKPDEIDCCIVWLLLGASLVVIGSVAGLFSLFDR